MSRKRVALAAPFVAQTSAVVAAFAARGVAVRCVDVKRSHHAHSVGDRYLIKIRYCSQILQWMVMFDLCQPDAPPDFIFDEASSPAFDIADIVALAKAWDVSDDRCLTRTVETLLTQYARYQAGLLALAGQERLVSEYESVKALDGLEMSVLQGQDAGSGGADIVMVCLLPMLDLSVNGPEACRDGHRATLTVRYEVTGTRLVVNSTFLAPPHLPITAKVAVPAWQAQINLANYRVLVIDALRASWLARHGLLEALHVMFPDRLEYDEDDCGMVSFIATIAPGGGVITAADTTGDAGGTAGSGSGSGSGRGTPRGGMFRCIVKVELSAEYPVRCPMMTFQAMHTGLRGHAPVVSIASGYPYSPRWPTDEMATRLCATMGEQMAQLQARMKAGAA